MKLFIKKLDVSFVVSMVYSVNIYSTLHLFCKVSNLKNINFHVHRLLKYH